MEQQTPSSCASELLACARSKELSLDERRALIQHPHLPIEGLLLLGRMEPKLFFAHPMVRLLLVTDGSFLDKLPVSLKMRMVELGVHLGPETLRRLGSNPDDPIRLRIVIARNPMLPADLARVYLRQCVAIRRALARNTGLAPALVNRLGRDESHRVRRVVAGRADVPRSVVRRLVVDAVPEVRWVLAKNEKCPRFGLEALSVDAYPPIRASANESLGRPREDAALMRWMSEGGTPSKKSHHPLEG